MSSSLSCSLPPLLLAYPSYSKVDVKIFRESSPIKESVIEEQVAEIVKENGIDHSEENGVEENGVEENGVGESEVTEAESSTLNNTSTDSTATNSLTEEFVIVEKVTNNQFPTFSCRQSTVNL